MTFEFIANHKWMTHVKNKPMPCNPDDLIYVIRRCDLRDLDPIEKPRKAKTFNWDGGINNPPDEVMYWRYHFQMNGANFSHQIPMNSTTPLASTDDTMNSLNPPRSSAATLGEAYTTDLMPLWRYILWKLNPLRLVRRKPALRWTTIRPHLSGTYMVLVMPDADYPEKAMAVCHVDADFIDTDHINARIWGQTKPISEYPVNYLWYGPVPLPTSR